MQRVADVVYIYIYIYIYMCMSYCPSLMAHLRTPLNEHDASSFRDFGDERLGSKVLASVVGRTK